MKITLETLGVTADDLESHPRVSGPCEAIVEVVQARERKQDILLLLRVIQATSLSQVGRQHAEYLHLPSNNAESAEMLNRRLLRFALALGLLAQSEIDAGQPVDLDFAQAIGKQAVVQFSARRAAGPQIGFFGIWGTHDPAAPSVSGNDTAES